MNDKADVRIALYSAALGDMRAANRPKGLVKSLSWQAEDAEPGHQEHVEACTREEDFTTTLRIARPTDQFVELWRKHLSHWDQAVEPTWSSSEPQSADRRGDVYDRLGLGEETRVLLDRLIPIYRTESAVVISEKHKEWYSAKVRQGREFYWPEYRKLLYAKGWPEHSIGSLDDASEKIVARLADPSAPEAYQARGLAVGYVQSGKTANFAGVIAKALDAGYRLVIVLGGTLNLLRAQTQRRLDMELVGRQNILRGASELESDYADDPAWAQGKFVSFGDGKLMPSAMGGFDIVRMTTRVDDYKSLRQGIVALEFEKQEPALPLYDPRNLHRTAARLMVIKKNKTVLGKLVNDLKKIRTPLSEIPTLIIDDEADEASVNTANPTKPDADRTAINQKISELLTILPRAQYIGYTATPYANVFVDPSDTEDVYPKDFIVSLPRPDGYMGARDFHDLDSPLDPEERTFANSNEKAHVRDIVVTDEDDDESLQEALDMFVLTGAMKLYREEEGGLGDRYFQHHTMLVHQSMRTAVARELLGQITKLWWDAGYTGPRGRERLRRLFEDDVLPVARARADGQAVPESYDRLAPYVGAAVTRIGGDDRPVIVVNSDKDVETGEADFDRRQIWKILVGGQKLSRGFTVEGLTVSYFRRTATNNSTLMQMGRWFGFRSGYRDLVRLYLGRTEKAGRKELDLYEAFEAICLDEEAFRSELRQYAAPVDGQPQITPKDVPPLVSSHLPRIKPTSDNKMYNARMVLQESAGQMRDLVAYPESVKDLRHNTALWTPVLELLSEQAVLLEHPGDDERGGYRYSALTGRLDAAEFLDLVTGLRWVDETKFLPVLAYLRKITNGEAGKVDDWVVLAPQHAKGGNRATIGGVGRTHSWFARDRRRPPLFGAIRDPKHVGAALRIAGAMSAAGNKDLEGLVAPKRGAVLLYPTVEAAHRDEVRETGVVDPGKLVMAFAFAAPASARSKDGRMVRFETIDSSRGPIIDAR